MSLKLKNEYNISLGGLELYYQLYERIADIIGVYHIHDLVILIQQFYFNQYFIRIRIAICLNPIIKEDGV
jgi:hypothetical protein